MMTFGEYCEESFGASFPDWQKQFLDRYYERFEERKRKGEPMIVNVSRKSAKASLALEITRNLIGYLDYLERIDNK